MKSLLKRGDELALSLPVLLEILRGPQGDAVTAEKKALLSALVVPPMNHEITEIASKIMVSLAKHSPIAHRLPVSDLLTAAQAQQLRAGILHADHDYEQIAQNGGVDVPTRHCQVDDGDASPPRARHQRELKREIAQLLHRLPVDRAEAVLARFRDELRAELGDSALDLQG